MRVRRRQPERPRLREEAMKPHLKQDAATRELSSLYTLGFLTAEERRGYEAHLLACGPCRDELSGLAPVLEAIAESAACAPAESLKERVLERIRDTAGERPASPRGSARARLARGSSRSRRQAKATTSPAGPASRSVQSWKHWQQSESQGSFQFVPASGGGWERTAVDGVEVRRLALDPEADRVTMLVRMRAGTSYPAHLHRGAEECFVLEGDLRAGELHMRAGDYLLARAGSVHPLQSTDAGCLLFIASSLQDELLDSR